MITEDTDAPDAEGGRKSPGFTQRRKMQRLSHSANYRNFMRENIKDGDYVFAPEMQGVYYVIFIISHYSPNNPNREVVSSWSLTMMTSTTFTMSGRMS